jgi:mono/diheme cytochrome c family protein
MANRYRHGFKFAIFVFGEEKMIETIPRKHAAGAVTILAFFLFAIPYSAAAQSGKSEAGQKLYEQNCAKCHGPDGSGNTSIGKAVGAKDLRSAEARKLTEAEIATQIEQGKGNMPPFSGILNKAQISEIVPYVHELAKKQAASKKAP